MKLTIEITPHTIKDQTVWSATVDYGPRFTKTILVTNKESAIDNICIVAERCFKDHLLITEGELKPL